ncbi:MAG: hypothetical protein ABH829_04370 [archaeon]
MFGFFKEKTNFYKLEEKISGYSKQGWHSYLLSTYAHNAAVKSLAKRGKAISAAFYIESKLDAAELSEVLARRIGDFTIAESKLSQLKLSEIEQLYLTDYLSGELSDKEIYPLKMRMPDFEKMLKKALTGGKNYLLDIGCWNEEFLDALEDKFFSKNKYDHLLIGTDSGDVTCGRVDSPDKEDEHDRLYDPSDAEDEPDTPFREFYQFEVESKHDIADAYYEAWEKTGILNELPDGFKRDDILRFRYEKNILTLHGFLGDYLSTKRLFKKDFLEKTKFDVIFLRRMFPYVDYKDVFEETNTFTKSYFIVSYSLPYTKDDKPNPSPAELLSELKKYGFKKADLYETETFFWLLAKKK